VPSDAQKTRARFKGVEAVEFIKKERFHVLFCFSLMI
jgi:hypothetical protein